MKPQRHTFLSLWGWPIAMGVLTTSGLITALVSDTWGDWWSWLGLGIPVAVMGWFSWRRPAQSPPPATIAAPQALTHAPMDAAEIAEPGTSTRSASL